MVIAIGRKSEQMQPTRENYLKTESPLSDGQPLPEVRGKMQGKFAAASANSAKVSFVTVPQYFSLSLDFTFLITLFRKLGDAREVYREEGMTLTCLFFK